MWGCKKHWFMVPKIIRDRVWKHYRPGQENDKQPNAEYLVAARQAVVAVAEQEGIVPDTLLYDLFLEAVKPLGEKGQLCSVCRQVHGPEKIHEHE